MVPVHGFPPGAERGHPPRLSLEDAGYVDTGFGCRVSRDARTLTITAPPPGVTCRRGLSFPSKGCRCLVANADPDATIVALPDSHLGQRLAGAAAEPR